MKLSFEYSAGLMAAELPDNTDMFIPGETMTGPPCIPEDRLMEKTLGSIHNPVGMEPLFRLAHKGSKMAIIFPDRAKGGEQPTFHRKISIKLILKELYDAGVEKEDILSICSNGLHRKNAEAETHNILGDELFHEFWHPHQIISHDSEDYEHLVDLGTADRDDPVLINKYMYDSDIAVLIGHVQGNSCGGYSGGYKHCTTGITRQRSIASYHAPEVIYRKGFTPVNGKSLMRTKFDEIGRYMEKCMGKEFFRYDTMLDIKPRRIEINSGYTKVIRPYSWITTDKRIHAPWAERKYDVMIFDMPQFFHYGGGMSTNPITLIQAISAQAIRHGRIMSGNCMIICSSLCNGYFHNRLWPCTRGMYDMSQRGFMNTLPDMNRHGEYFATNEGYIRKYHYCNAFHPLHGFSMINYDHIAGVSTSVIYLCGTQKPDCARGTGLKTRVTIEETLADTRKKFVEQNPNILTLPQTFRLGATHLMMKDEAYGGKGQEDCGYVCHVHRQMV